MRVGEIGGHIPPLDAEFRMWPVVGGKCEGPAGHDRRKSIRAFTKPGKTLRERLAAQSCEERAADEAAAGDRAATVHWQKS